MPGAFIRAAPFLFALGGIAAAFGVLYVQERRSAAREHEAVVSEVRAMMAASADSRPAIVREVVVTVPAIQPAPVAAPTAATTAPSPTPPPAHATRFDGMDPKSMPAEVDATFRSEAVDAAWARPTSGALQAYFDGVATDGASVSSVECRSETCLVTARFAAASDRDAFLRRSFTPGPDSMYARANMSMYAPVPEANGSVLTGRIYLFRDGASGDGQ